MYRIKFPSGEVATIESPEALTEAVRSGSVTSYCFIMHERSGQWLPIVRHPHYHQALTARAAASGAPAAAVAAILPDPLAAPPAPNVPATKDAAERSTQAALDVPDLDALLEMTDGNTAEPVSAPAPVAGPAAAPAPPRPRGRSRELEFLYVPEAKAAVRPPAAPRTAGPPPRPAATKAPASPKAPAAPAPAPSLAPSPAPVRRDITPKAEAPTAPTAQRPEPTPAPALAPTTMRAPDPKPEPAATHPTAALATAAPPVAAVTPPVAAVAPPVAAEAPPVATVAPPVATIAPPMRRPAERYDYDLVDPVEAALSFDAPAPIKLTDERPRDRAPGGSRRLFIAAGLVVALGGGLLAWSPWTGAPEEVAAASMSPADRVEPRNEEAPAEPVVDMPTPAEEEPEFDIYSMPADDPGAARTSFGGTAAQAGAAIPEPAAPQQGVLPRAPRNLRVAVPVVGGGENLDSLRLAQVKQAITE